MHHKLTLSSAPHKTAAAPHVVAPVSLCCSCIHNAQPWSFCEDFNPQEEHRRGCNLVVSCRGHEAAMQQ